ncbi:GbsR/MarR family transcriptional regulator [Chloroflexota bacterium]
MSDSLHNKERAFVEEVGVVFEQTGLPRMSGRIFGWLLISEPPYQSSSELAEVLQASKGSISTTTRLLIQIGLIERFVIPGVRHDHFCLQRDALPRIIKHGLEDEIKMLQKLSEHGLELLRSESSERRKWLNEMYERYTFLDREFPSLMERYEKQRAEKKAKVVTSKQ